jgi:hypothetical protein
MSTTKWYIKLESANNSGYFVNIAGTDLKTSENINDAVDFESLESASALIDYVLPMPLTGSWKVVQHGIS